MMLVKYNTCLGSIDVQERNWLFKGLFSLVVVSLKNLERRILLKIASFVGLRQRLSAKVTGYH